MTVCPNKTDRNQTPLLSLPCMIHNKSLYSNSFDSLGACQSEFPQKYFIPLLAPESYGLETVTLQSKHMQQFKSLHKLMLFDMIRFTLFHFPTFSLCLISEHYAVGNITIFHLERGIQKKTKMKFHKMDDFGLQTTSKSHTLT